MAENLTSAGCEQLKIQECPEVWRVREFCISPVSRVDLSTHCNKEDIVPGEFRDAEGDH